MIMTTAIMLDGVKNEKWKAILQKAKTALAKGREIRVSPDRIQRMKDQPRVHFGQAGLNFITESMKEMGQITAGLLRRIPRSGKIDFELLDGERRLIGCTRAGINFRGILVNIDDEIVPYVIAAVANFNREGHTPTEVSDSIHRLRSLEIPMYEIAKLFGISEMWAGQMHGLQNLHPRVRDMLNPDLPKDRKLPITAAVALSKADISIQFDLARKVLDKKIGLGILRGTVIKASMRAGKQIRLYHRKPSHRWTSIKNKSAQLERTLNDLEVTVRDLDILKSAGLRPDRELRMVVEAFSSIAEKALRCKSQIESIRK